MGVSRLKLAPTPPPYTSTKMFRAIVVLCLAFYITFVLSAPSYTEEDEDVSVDGDKEIGRDERFFFRPFCFCLPKAGNTTGQSCSGRSAQICAQPCSCPAAAVRPFSFFFG